MSNSTEVDHEIVAIGDASADQVRRHLRAFALRNWLIVIAGTGFSLLVLISLHPLVGLLLVFVPLLLSRRASRLLHDGRVEKAERSCLNIFRYTRFLGLMASIGPTDCFLTYQNCLYRQALFIDVEMLNKRAAFLTAPGSPGRVPDDITSLNHLGMVYCAQRRFAEAEQCSRRALDLAGKDFFCLENSLHVALLDTLGWIYVSSGRFEEAERILVKAGKLCEKRARNHRDRGHILLMSARCAMKSDDLELAESCIEEAQGLGEERFNRDDPYIGCGYDVLGELRARQGRLEEALLYLENALSLKELLLVPCHPEIACTLRSCAAVLDRLDEGEKAAEARERAARIEEAHQLIEDCRKEEIASSIVQHSRSFKMIPK